jgi:C-terminal processing protease CtpA/Prc
VIRAASFRPLVLGLLLAAAPCACGPMRGTIGAVLGQTQDGRLFVREVPPDLAAAKAGLRPDDQILLIDGKDVRMLSAKQIHQALSGDVGDKVKLTVLRGEQVVRVTLARSAAPPLGHAAR